MAPVTRRRPSNHRRPSTAGGSPIHGLKPKATQGGHLLSANRARGLSPRQDLVNRATVFQAAPKKHPVNDRPQMLQGTRGGRRK